MRQSHPGDPAIMKRIYGAALAASLGAAVALAAPASGSPDPVPVLGQSWVAGTEDPRLAVLTIHGVRRVDGAAVVYYSMGLRPQDQTGKRALFGNYGYGFYSTLTQSSASSLTCTVAAVDVAGGTAYAALRTSVTPGRCISSRSLDFVAPADHLARAVVAYTLIASIPASVSAVDVFVGAHFVQNVPVEDGLLEPVVDAEVTVVGKGWPSVDTAAIATAIKPEDAVRPLRTRTDDLAQKISTGRNNRGEEITLDAAVLFAIDTYSLTPKAQAVIAAAAKKIRAQNPTGAIQVVGHTDSTNTDAYNLTLSKRRAAAVAAALKKLLPATTTITTDGKGESEPIATNTSERGRALNRRVTITVPTS